MSKLIKRKGHLKNAAEYANRKADISYYIYHAWIALRAGSVYLYIGYMSIIHGLFPFTFSGFSLAKLIVKQTNQIRQSIPEWNGWEKLENWKDEEYK
jgi:hypothetical protein